MELTIKQRGGLPKRILVRKAVEDFIHLFCDDQTRESLKSITVHVVKQIEKKATTTWANCHHVSEGVFVIRIRKDLAKDDFISTMIHEMKHVLQFSQKSLSSTSEGFFWQNRFYCTSDTTSEEYYNHPWEVEARQCEELYMKILSSRKRR